MFTALETLILRNRGVLNLDDPVDKLLSLTYHTNYGPITFRQLMSHMSGLNTFSPPGDASGSWPKSPEGESSSGHATLAQVLESIASHRPIAPPYTFPVYSNTGYKLLGLANVAANRAFENHTDAPSTHAELMHRDVFTPLGLKDSSFLTSPTNRANVVVPSIQPGDIDDDHGDASNPSGGQLSSVSDLVKVMQTLIDPSRPESAIPAITVREWLRPIHSWVDDYTAVGAPWEIIKPKDSYGRTQPLYQKLGEMPGYHSGFIINPTSSYGIIILSTGPMTQTIPLTNLIFDHVQPAFDAIMEAEAHKSLVGSWLSDDGQDNIAIDIEAGSLYVTRYILNGTDVLAVMHNHIGSGKLPLWPTSENEYR
ncbi:hypothetical protein SERLADRAFT_474737 [Serpula lacrymans var. lacrymans S7.9]|nr:uncharacterized protein SERLADRAFT_474737 [Serpula lacrymans var. lacrymans S7.9]EGO21816.1 hypothetical protein SERLADRAFT_474737 [Serpula lacrymans var. lacrymans S7.9]